MKINYLFLAAIALATGAHAAPSFQNGQPASGVIGQPDFKTGDEVFGLPNRLCAPGGVAYDAASGKVFVSDSDSNRVLRFASLAAAESGANPDMVFGQANSTAHDPNRGAATASDNTLSVPFFITVDAKHRLWVADTGNNRVVGYFSATTTSAEGIAADIVLGDFSSGGNSQISMVAPLAVAVGPDDTLWVSDTSNHRVLAFFNVSTKSSGNLADGVLGQADFTAKAPGVNESGMQSPTALCADANGRLWVAEGIPNRRVLRFDAAATKAAAPAQGKKASGVLGQSSLAASDQGAFDEFHVNDCFGVYLDATGTLWVSDASFPHRVMGFPNAAQLANGAAATLVLGEPTLKSTSSAALLVEQVNFGFPAQIAGGPGGSLLIADQAYNRVLRFSPIETPKPAAPKLTLTGKKKITTTKSKVTLKGSTTGQVTSVTYRIGNKPEQKARGTAQWSLKPALKLGTNKLTITAHGPGGNSAPAKVTVVRK